MSTIEIIVATIGNIPTIEIIEIIAATIGILYVILEMRASMWLWPVGIVLPFFYIYISWQSHVYGNIIVNVYYLIACILGWIAWHKSRGKEQNTPRISWAPPMVALITLIISVLMVPVLSYLFHTYMDSPFPIWDAIATSVSLVGMWFLAKEYIETWYCWILSNVIYCALYFIQGYFVTGCFFVVYSIVAVWGLIRWIKLSKA